MDYQNFVSECLNFTPGSNRGGLLDRNLGVKKYHSEQSKAYDDDMEVDANSISPSSGPFEISKESIGSANQNCNESSDSDKAVFESSSGTKSFMCISSRRSQGPSVNQFSSSVLEEAKR